MNKRELLSVCDLERLAFATENARIAIALIAEPMDELFGCVQAMTEATRKAKGTK